MRIATTSRMAALLCAALLAPASAPAREPLDGPAVRTIGESRVRTVSETREVHDVATRGVYVRLLVEKADAPVAVAVLFAGGAGATKIGEHGYIGQLGGNFLVRSRDLFRSNGLTAVVFDSPSDTPDDLRTVHDNAEFAEDVGAVIRHLRGVLKLPVWLIGTSRGTVAVANAASRLKKDRPDGVVFTATLFSGGRYSDVYYFDLDQIRVPTLIVHHREDSCRYTLPGEVESFREDLENAKPLKVLMVEGGYARGNPCQARHYHGFNGIEDEVVSAIARWIRNPAP